MGHWNAQTIERCSGYRVPIRQGAHCGTVELGCGEITPLGELALVPPAAQDAFAGFDGSGPLGHSTENVLHALGIVRQISCRTREGGYERTARP
jgi:hypothetical protein